MQLKITNKNKTKQRNNNINTMENRRGEDGRGWGWVAEDVVALWLIWLGGVGAREGRGRVANIVVKLTPNS